VPTDAVSGPAPGGLSILSSGAGAVFDAASSKGWDRIAASTRDMTAAWKTYQAGEVPELLAAQMTDALNALAGAVKARNPADTRQAALDVTQTTLDLQLRHRPAAELDPGRLDLWARQLQLDAAAKDKAGVAGDVVALQTTWDRVGHSVDPAKAERVKAELGKLSAAAGKDLGAAAAAVPALRALAGTQPSG
jgi:hypothetical protein